MSGNTFELVKRWDHNGIDCLIVRRPSIDMKDGRYPGNYCGYARIPDGAKLMDDYQFAPAEMVQAFKHYDINFAGTPVHSGGGTWYGFDMGHCYDYGPPMKGWPYGTYIRTLNDAITETEHLADVMTSYLETVTGAHRACRYCDSDFVGVTDYYCDVPKDGYAATCYECGARGPIAETIDEAWEAWDRQC